MRWIQPEQSGGSCLPANRTVGSKVTRLQKVFSRLMMFLKRSFWRKTTINPKEEKKEGSLACHVDGWNCIRHQLCYSSCRRQKLAMNVFQEHCACPMSCSLDFERGVVIQIHCHCSSCLQGMRTDFRLLKPWVTKTNCWDGIFDNFPNIGALYMLPRQWWCVFEGAYQRFFCSSILHHVLCSWYQCLHCTTVIFSG